LVIPQFHRKLKLLKKMSTINQINKTIGKSLKAIRLAGKLTQEDISKKLGTSIPAYSKIESGITDVNLSRLDDLAVIYGISVRELITYNEHKDVVDPEEIAGVLGQIAEREEEIYNLQKKIIELFEEIKLV